MYPSNKSDDGLLQKEYPTKMPAIIFTVMSVVAGISAVIHFAKSADPTCAPVPETEQSQDLTGACYKPLPKP